MSNTRAEIRQSIRKKRNSLTVEQQKNAAIALKVNFTQHLKSLKTPKNAHIGIYFSNDGELDTSLLIKELWVQGQHLYLPIIHPFNGTTLYFQRYEENSPMTTNRYGILELQRRRIRIGLVSMRPSRTGCGSTTRSSTCRSTASTATRSSTPALGVSSSR